MQVLATYNIKGGVGKTTSAVNLAYTAAKEGHRVLVWDLDSQGAASFYFRIKPKLKGGIKKLIKFKHKLKDVIRETNYSNIDLVPADFSNRNMDLLLKDAKNSDLRLAHLISGVKHDYDYIFLDCPPSLSMTSENVFNAADFLLVPLIPTYLSVRAYKQLNKFRKDRNDYGIVLLPFFSMVDIRRRLHRDVVDEFYRENPEVLKTFIAYSSLVEQMGRYMAPLQTYALGTNVSKSFSLLWHEIFRRIN